MNEYLLLYLFTRVDSFIEASGLVLAIGIPVILYYVILYIIENNIQLHAIDILKKYIIPPVVVAALICIFTPTQKELALIVGGKFAIDIAQSEEVTETGKKIYTIIQQKLDEQIKKE